MTQQPFHFIVKHGDKYYLTHHHWEFATRPNAIR